MDQQTLRIVSDGTAFGTKVFTPSGENIKGITAVQVHPFGPGDLVKATLTVIGVALGSGTEAPESPLRQALADACNQWMDDYTNNPDAYEETSASALNHLREKLNGEEPSYGQTCAAILMAYMDAAGK